MKVDSKNWYRVCCEHPESDSKWVEYFDPYEGLSSKSTPEVDYSVPDQYTGEVDCDGTKLFENDQVEFIDAKNRTCKAIIFFRRGGFGCRIYEIDGESIATRGWGYDLSCLTQASMDDPRICKLIGNVHGI